MFSEELLSEATEVILGAANKRNVVVNFSGGKDSSAVLFLVCDLVKQGLLDKTRVKVYHSDTTIEYPLLTNLTSKVLDWVSSVYGVEVIVGVAPPEKRLFALMFGVGYPVPSHFVRWCTDQLKIRPGMLALGKDVIRVTGEHKGESKARDKRLSSTGCGSSECGTDRLDTFFKDGLCKPIVNWTNCAVWDYLFYADLAGLTYDGFFNEISKVYEVSNDDDKNTSLRMGCISCPVVNTTKAYDTEHKGVPNKLSLKLRLVFEAMRGDENRVKNPRSKNGKRTMGAIALPMRRYYWRVIKEINQEFADIGLTLISKPEFDYIEQSLLAGNYPQTYKRELIPKLEEEWRERQPEWMRGLDQ